MEPKRNPVKLAKELSIEELLEQTNHLCPFRSDCLGEIAGKKHPDKVAALSCVQCDFFNVRPKVEQVTLSSSSISMPIWQSGESHTHPSDMEIF